MLLRSATLAVIALLWTVAPCWAQGPGPQVKMIKEGIYVAAAKDQDANVNIILTQDGVVMIDTGQTIEDARNASSLVRKLTPQPVRYIIHTEPHADHTVGDFLLSPPATVIAAAGAAQLIKQNKPAADPGYRQVLPQIEFKDRMSLNVGGRAIELMFLKNVHSGADTGIWMPQEKIVFAAATVGVNRFPNLRPFLTIPDIVASIRMMKALNPEIVVPGHGAPGTTQIFDDMERYYAVLLERVGRLAAAGRTLEQVTAELKMPEYDHWSAKERFPTNVEAAWRAVRKN